MNDIIMNDEIMRLIANPNKIKKNNNIHNDYYEDIYNLLIRKFSEYEISYKLYNNILNKIENLLIENTIIEVINSIILDIYE